MCKFEVENTMVMNSMAFEKLDFKDIDHIVFAGMGGSGSIGDTPNQ